MAAVLDVWVARPGDACHVDDRAWTVHVLDAHGAPYHWASADYSSLLAPQAHWAGTIPPGCYVVSATLDGSGGKVATDHVIANVGCDGSGCVRLYVAGSHREPPTCEISIEEVTASGDTIVTSVQVAGTALGCDQVEVAVSCGGSAQQTLVVTVASDGRWKATFEDLRQLECGCGGHARVTATCAADPRCRTEWSGALECPGTREPG